MLICWLTSCGAGLLVKYLWCWFVGQLVVVLVCWLNICGAGLLVMSRNMTMLRFIKNV